MRLTSRFFNYSNTNTILIGMAVEAVAGKPLGDVVREQVIVPAGLKNTFWPRGSEFPAPHPMGYSEQTPDGNEADVTNWNPSWGGAAGVMISTADDLHRWVGELTTGRLLSRASQAQRLKFVPIPGNVGNVGYGLGVIDSNVWIGHNGDLPGFSSSMYRDPDRDLTMIVVTNTDTHVERDGDIISPSASFRPPPSSPK
ncbi:serine hydrolase domain-containing protein [Deinococcus aestuarii]|uniref:serine hydrolase domain-containing protein n=1 Tax=Deinococcus aestuarii TaxID=2774531 RepID=UPI001C0C474D|nr:serine hydrolase domain-containing protein [Deinococcus aestuarii]